MQKREVLATPTFWIDGSIVYPQLIGDSGYPISPYLLKPFQIAMVHSYTLFLTNIYLEVMWILRMHSVYLRGNGDLFKM